MIPKVERTTLANRSRDSKDKPRPSYSNEFSDMLRKKAAVSPSSDVFILSKEHKNP